MSRLRLCTVKSNGTDSDNNTAMGKRKFVKDDYEDDEDQDSVDNQDTDDDYVPCLHETDKGPIYTSKDQRSRVETSRESASFG